jgi:hypothetical protein
MWFPDDRLNYHVQSSLLLDPGLSYLNLVHILTLLMCLMNTSLQMNVIDHSVMSRTGLGALRARVDYSSFGKDGVFWGGGAEWPFI